MENFSKREGFGIEHIYCQFADYYEPWEEDYFGETGVAFYFDYPAVKEDITLILDEETFYMYLIKASEKYLARYPEEEQIVKELLEKIKSNLKFPGSKWPSPLLPSIYKNLIIKSGLKIDMAVVTSNCTYRLILAI